MKSYFVAGTDTGVGKTLVSAAILHGANQGGYSTLGLKPVAAGCESTDGEWQNEDAQLLMRYASEKLAYGTINPIALREAIAPHIAAANENRKLTVDHTASLVNRAMGHKADVCLVEGAGGWRVPLNSKETMADLARSLKMPVVLVVGMRLGCLNHAILTAESIAHDGVSIAGWVANMIDPDMPEQEPNIATLQERFAFPLLGIIPHLAPASVEVAADCLDLSYLIG